MGLDRRNLEMEEWRERGRGEGGVDGFFNFTFIFYLLPFYYVILKFFSKKKFMLF